MWARVAAIGSLLAVGLLLTVNFPAPALGLSSSSRAPGASAPYAGHLEAGRKGGTFGCGTLQTRVPTFNVTSGVARLEQNGSGTESPCAGYRVSMANGSTWAGIRTPIRLSAGYHSVEVHWYVHASMTVRLRSPDAVGSSFATDECSGFGIFSVLVNSTRSSVWAGNVSYPANLTAWPTCLSGNVSATYTATGDYIDWFNQTFSGGLWYVLTVPVIGIGLFLGQAGSASIAINVATAGDYAQLVGITVVNGAS